MRKSLRLPLFHMNIAAYFLLPLKGELSGKQNFIVETFFLVIRRHPEHIFYILTHKKSAEQFSPYSNTETIAVKPVPKNLLLKRIWWDMKLPSA